MLIYGHRGAAASVPENTLASFATSIAARAAGIELDVQATCDRVPVVLHDRDLFRTTNHAGLIDRLTLPELAGIDAGGGERIPTLARTLALVGGDVHLDLEIKQGGIEAEVLAVLAGFPDARWSISSFDWTSLIRIRALAPAADLWVLAIRVSDAVLSIAAEIGASAVSLHHEALTVSSANRLRAAGLGVVVWTVNDIAEARRCRDLGAAGLCTDDPAAIIAALDAR